MFLQLKPSARIFFRQILFFFPAVKSCFIIYVFVLSKLFYTHNRSKDIGHFLKQNLFKDVHAMRGNGVMAEWIVCMPCNPATGVRSPESALRFLSSSTVIFQLHYTVNNASKTVWFILVVSAEHREL